MKRIIARYFLLLVLTIPFTSLHSSAQDVTGIWKGYFISNDGDYYKLEFQVAQSNTNSVTGVSYSYLDVRFYGKATMTGNFLPGSSSFRIREIRTVEVKSSIGGATCIMNYEFKYSKSGKEEFLEGTYLGKYEGKYAVSPSTWGDCGGGKVYLRKVTTSDFYVEPFLRKRPSNKPVIINQPPVKKDSVKTKPVTPPVKKSVVPTKPNTTPKPVVTTKPVTKPTTPPVVKTKPVTKPVTPPVTKTNTDSIKTKVTPPVVKTNPVTIPRPAVLKNRANELVKVLTVNDPDVVIKIYDNGEIDGDTISVYLDNKKVLSSQGLTASPLIVKFKMEEEDTEHELVMVAENLGRIPPNTSLMIVEAGGQRFEVRITSTEQKNAVVKFRYQKPG